MRQVVAADIGTVRIGVAVSDPLCMFAQALCFLKADGPWMEELADIIRERRADVLLVGMPRRTDGTDGPEASAMRKKIGRLKTMLPDVEVEEWDERFTTSIANRVLIEADVSRSDRKVRVDKVAAAVLLQSYLDAHASPEGETSSNAQTPPLFDMPSSARRSASSRHKSHKRERR